MTCNTAFLITSLPHVKERLCYLKAEPRSGTPEQLATLLKQDMAKNEDDLAEEAPVSSDVELSVEHEPARRVEDAHAQRLAEPQRVDHQWSLPGPQHKACPA